MAIDFGKTKEFYISYSEVCTCAVCENYIRGIEVEYPELKEKLEQFGIDIQKPHEVEGFAMPKKNAVDYYNVMYIVLGVWDDILECEISNLKIRKAESHPRTGVVGEHFVIDVIGEMTIPWNLSEDIHVAYPETVNQKTTLIEKFFGRKKK